MSREQRERWNLCHIPLYDVVSEHFDGKLNLDRIR